MRLGLWRGRPGWSEPGVCESYFGLGVEAGVERKNKGFVVVGYKVLGGLCVVVVEGKKGYVKKKVEDSGERRR